MCNSDIKIPSQGQLHMWAPGSVGAREECERDCMRVGAFDVPHSHKLTTPLFSGAPCACQMFWRKQALLSAPY